MGKIDLEKIVTPATPPSGHTRIYAKTDDTLAYKLDDGSEVVLGSEAITSLTGEVTGTGPGATATTITNDAVTNAKLNNMSTQTIKGRTTAGTGDPEDLTATQATAVLNNFVGDSGSGGTKGLVPAPAAGDAAASKFLKADGTWIAPSGSGDVAGPASATDNAIARFDSTTGKLIKNSVGILSDAGALSGVTASTDILTSGTLPIARGGTNSGTALNNNRVMQSSAGAIIEASAITASRALVSDANGIPIAATTTTTELNYVNGVTSAIQTQLGLKAFKADVQTFAGSDTWIKPSGAKIIQLLIAGGGGGGGGGCRQSAATNASGGGGGGGATFIEVFFDATYIGSSETVTIGVGGNGGTGATVNGNAGSDGVAGGNSSFGSHITSYSGGGGSNVVTAANSGSGGSAGIISGGGTASGTTEGTAGTLGGQTGGTAGGNTAIFCGGPGGTGTVAAAGGIGKPTINGASGGGGGGGTSAASSFAGGSGGRNLGYLSIISGGTAGGGAGVNPSTTAYLRGLGGSGGGGNNAGAGGSGGAGGLAGAGGGGGGVGTAANGGNGGAGGNGLAVVITYF